MNGEPILKEKDKPKKKVWKTSYADKRFSQYIIQRDKRCLRCGKTERLTCSHYWRRGHSGGRFSPNNCICLCLECHSLWENLKNNEYKDFMLQRLGQVKYDELERECREFKKRSDAVEECKKFLSAV